jgi:hypothetical protein
MVSRRRRPRVPAKAAMAAIGNGAALDSSRACCRMRPSDSGLVTFPVYAITPPTPISESWQLTTLSELTGATLIFT